MIYLNDDGRVRSLHESRRPRAFRPSLGDSEARRGSPQGCREESASARPETKTPSPRFPRLSRPKLEGFNRLSHLAGDFGKGEALAYDLRYGHIEAVSVSHFAVFGGAIVITPSLFVQITE